MKKPILLLILFISFFARGQGILQNLERLRVAQSQSSSKVIFLGDIHDDYPNLNAVASQILSRNPSLLINAGDIYPNGSYAEFEETLTPYQSLIDAQKYYHVKGDHELNTQTAIGDLTLGSTIFSNTASWKYISYPNSTALPTDWKLSSFDDSSWSTGNGSFGFGSITGKTIATTLTSSRINYMFRKTVNSSAITSNGVVIQCSIDDSAEIYINGNLVYSFNMEYPISATSTSIKAIGSTVNVEDARLYPEGYDQIIRIPSSVFQSGDNQVAVLLKNRGTSSSDVFMQMAMYNYTFPSHPTFGSMPFYATGFGDGMSEFLPYLPNYGEMYSVVKGNVEYFFITSGRQDVTNWVGNPVMQGSTSKQADWLKAALANSTATFKALVTHDVPVTTVTAYNRDYFDYLLGNPDYPLDLFLCGDTHVSEAYEHVSGLIVANASNHDTTSRSGSSIKATTPTDWTQLFHNNTNGANYFIEITTTSTSLTMQWIDKDGAIIHTETITKP